MKAPALTLFLILSACASPPVKGPDATKDPVGRFVWAPFTVLLETYAGCLKESEVRVELFAEEGRRIDFSARLEFSKVEPFEPTLKEFRVKVIKATDLDPKVVAATLACSEVTQDVVNRLWKNHFDQIAREKHGLLDSDRFTATGTLYPEFDGKVVDSVGFTRIVLQPIGD
ncbi:MAG: hypothetical protein JNL01_05485 [Bdellovibrionales bacterium]|nr:hypothetical protein [Bdellovibrionales bacterium]